MIPRYKKREWGLWLCLFAFVSSCSVGLAAGKVLAADNTSAATALQEDGDDSPFDDEKQLPELADPLEPLNRLFFQFNDRLYFWAVKPVATVYANILARDIRHCINNAFDNMSTPIRVVNSILQGKFHRAGVDLARFVVNTTGGIVGLGDPAKDFGLVRSDEDFGQTLGVYGLGDVMYIHWPLLGPSSVRDIIGRAGDSFLNPLSYILADSGGAGIGVYAAGQINNASLTLGDYELFKKTSLDPYSAMRNAYHQYRHGRIDDLSVHDENPGFTGIPADEAADSLRAAAGIYKVQDNEVNGRRKS